MKVERGCESDAAFPYWTDLKGQGQLRCPRRPIFEDVRWYNSIIKAFNAYKNGFLPHEGGMNDQTALFGDIMSIVDSTVSECQKVIDKKGKSGGTGGTGGYSLLGRK